VDFIYTLPDHARVASSNQWRSDHDKKVS